MTVDRDNFFAQLEGLTPKEMEARLSEWDREELSLVQEYLEQKQLDHAKVTQAERAELRDSVLGAMQMASHATSRATIALIISIGAMLAAISSAVIAFLSQH